MLEVKQDSLGDVILLTSQGVSFTEVQEGLLFLTCPSYLLGKLGTFDLIKIWKGRLPLTGVGFVVKQNLMKPINLEL